MVLDCMFEQLERGYLKFYPRVDPLGEANFPFVESPANPPRTGERGHYRVIEHTIGRGLLASAMY